MGGDTITSQPSITDQARPGCPRVDGHAQVKTGNRVVGTPFDQIIVLGNSLAGYIQTKSGRQVTFMIAIGNVPISTPEEVLTITADQARMVEAI